MSGISSFAASDYLSTVLEGKKILLGISGSIAAFRACDVIRFLRQCGATVRVVMTRGAENFVTRTTLETLSGFPVLSSFWANEKDSESSQNTGLGTHHIDTARWADLILVAPATAHTLAKIAHGFADDLLSTEILAFLGPVVVVPAMNPAMFANSTVQENIQKLLDRKIQILGPTIGVTSCGEEGSGRMIEPERIVEEVAQIFSLKVTGSDASSTDSMNKNLLITLGPTRSPLDPVRYISNRSSGLMGAALCWAAVAKGFSVTAICGPTSALLPLNVRRLNIQTATEMAQLAQQEWPSHSIFIAAAAVLDWDIKNPASHKIKKELGPPVIEFSTNLDILATLSSSKLEHQYVLGFAAETQDVVKHAQAKRLRKKCDAIFANQVAGQTGGFESTQNAGWWIDETETTQFVMAPKAKIAHQILDHLIKKTIDKH